LGKITGHAGPVTDIRFVGGKLVSASKDATLLVWDWPKIAAQFRGATVSAGGNFSRKAHSSTTH